MYDDLDLNNALVVVIIKNQVEKFWVLHNQFGTILNLNIVNLEVRYAIFGNSNERTFSNILHEDFGPKIVLCQSWDIRLTSPIVTLFFLDCHQNLLSP